MKNLTFHATAAAIALLSLAPATHADPVLKFDHDTLTVAAGDSFELLLQGSGFDFTLAGLTINNISGGQKLNLSFTAGVLEIVNIAIDPRWTFTAANRPGTVDNAAGTLTGMAFGVFPATTDAAFNIARISFHALQAGPAAVVVTGADMAGRVNNVAGVLVASSFLPSTLQVSAVPEPQTWALWAAGLGLMAFRWRRG